MATQTNIAAPNLPIPPGDPDKGWILQFLSILRLFFIQLVSSVNTLINKFDNGSFTGTLTGCTTSPTATIYWARSGNLVTLTLPSNLTATSNAGTCTITGLPAALSPTNAQRPALGSLLDNTATTTGYAFIGAAATVISLSRTDGAAFTASGTKGFVAFTVTYMLV